MTDRCKPTPLDPKLYAKARRKVKARVKRWPSAYASGQLVQEYKRMGGRYGGCKPKKSGLPQWFSEEWVDICRPNLPACGRPDPGDTESTYRKNYPKCRPKKEARAMSASQRKAACRRKRAAVRRQPASSSKVVRVR